MNNKTNCTLAKIKEKLESGEKLTTLEEIFYLLNVNQKVAPKNTAALRKLAPAVSPHS